MQGVLTLIMTYWLKLLAPIFLLISLVLVGLNWLLAQPVSQVKVYGDIQYINLQQLEEASNPWLAASFWRLDLQGLKTSLEEDPWLKSVHLTRQWPNILRIELVERHPWAHWQGKLIDKQGEGFAPANASELTLARSLSVEEEKLAEAVKFWQDFDILLQANQLSLTQLTLTPRGSWQLKLTNGIEIYLGSSLIEQRLQQFILAWQGWLEMQSSNIASIDLRYPNGLAVAWLNPAAN